MNDSARQLWCEIYSGLSTGQPGLLGAITARAEAQTLRLALIYALLDGAREIDRVHIQAALAMWTYCAASARFIFGDLLGNTTADAILRALRKVAPSGHDPHRDQRTVWAQSPQRGYCPGTGAAAHGRESAVHHHKGTRAADRDLVCGIGTIQRSRTAQPRILRNKGSR